MPVLYSWAFIQSVNFTVATSFDYEILRHFWHYSESFQTSVGSDVLRTSMRTQVPVCLGTLHSEQLLPYPSSTGTVNWSSFYSFIRPVSFVLQDSCAHVRLLFNHIFMLQFVRPLLVFLLAGGWYIALNDDDVLLWFNVQLKAGRGQLRLAHSTIDKIDMPDKIKNSWNRWSQSRGWNVRRTVWRKKLRKRYVLSL